MNGGYRSTVELGDPEIARTYFEFHVEHIRCFIDTLHLSVCIICFEFINSSRLINSPQLITNKM